MSSEPPLARPAATVIVLRDGPRGLEVLMLRRSARTGFFPHAWVFPGGRVDDDDAAARTRGAVPGMADLHRPYAVAAIRETFEEAGVWLGEGQPDDALRAAMQHRGATLAAAPALVADLSRLRLWSWWCTPLQEPKRYDTLFFVARVDADAVASHDEIETTASAWVRPVDVLDGRHGGQDDAFFLAPPTWWTLRELVGHDSADAAFTSAGRRSVVRITPALHSGAGGRWEIVLPGDPSHPDTQGLDGPTRLAFVDGQWQGIAP